MFLPSQITLNDNLGKMALREPPAIMRFHQWSLQKQPEQYFHAQLLLYYPWRDEKDLLTESYQASYLQKQDTIQANCARFERHAENVAAAIEQLEQDPNLEIAWDNLAPQVTKNNNKIKMFITD